MRLTTILLILCMPFALGAQDGEWNFKLGYETIRVGENKVNDASHFEEVGWFHGIKSSLEYHFHPNELAPFVHLDLSYFGRNDEGAFTSRSLGGTTGGAYNLNSKYLMSSFSGGMAIPVNGKQRFRIGIGYRGLGLRLRNGWQTNYSDFPTTGPQGQSGFMRQESTLQYNNDISTLPTHFENWVFRIEICGQKLFRDRSIGYRFGLANTGIQLLLGLNKQSNQ